MIEVKFFKLLYKKQEWCYIMYRRNIASEKICLSPLRKSHELLLVAFSIPSFVQGRA